MKHLLPAFIVAFFSLPVAAQNSKFYMYIYRHLRA